MVTLGKILLIFICYIPYTTSFVPNPSILSKLTHARAKAAAGLPMASGWVSLVPTDNNASDDENNAPVKKLILQEGNGGDVPEQGSTVQIEYVGTLGSGQSSWTVDDVLECWLKNQQGLYDILADPFREKDIDGGVLLNGDVFDETYVADVLGVSNKIQIKKTIMAAKRLRKQIEEYPEGTEFDSSISRGKAYEFVLGKGKVIRAMDLLVSTMRVGEKAQVVCRCDYGYGNDGYRKATGEVVVPPFATLCFDITLLSVSAA